MGRNVCRLRNTCKGPLFLSWKTRCIDYRPVVCSASTTLSAIIHESALRLLVLDSRNGDRLQGYQRRKPAGTTRCYNHSSRVALFRISPCVAMETETAGSILCGVVTLAFYSQT